MLVKDINNLHTLILDFYLKVVMLHLCIDDKLERNNKTLYLKINFEWFTVFFNNCVCKFFNYLTLFCIFFYALGIK